MQENENKETNVKATIDAMTGLVTAIPIYQDTLQPSAKQIGKSLETVTKTVNIALAPVKLLVWGYEKIEEYITNRVAEKLKNIPTENITIPPISIAGPAVEALRFAGDDINLRELYANLLAASMDVTTQYLVHPGFVEIIKNLSGAEAIILEKFKDDEVYPLIDVKFINKDSHGEYIYEVNFSHFSKFLSEEYRDLSASYLENICRLGLTEIPHDGALTTPNTYEPLQNDPYFNSIKEKILADNQYSISYNRKVIRLTNLGKLFVENVVLEKEQ